MEMTQDIADTPKHTYDYESFPFDQQVKEKDNIYEDKQQSMIVKP